MNAYPVKLREKAIEAIEKGHKLSKVSEMFGVNTKTLRKWETLKAETGGLTDKPAQRKAYKIESNSLMEYYEQNPHSTNEEAAIAFNCSKTGIFYAKAADNITRKKNKFL